MALNGVIVVDKPQAWTSHDVVARCRKLLGERSIGHLGTLDPMATGVLPLVTGKMTRLSQFYSGSQKRYEGTIRLGNATDTYDADGDAVGPEQEVQVSLEDLQESVRSLTGPILQTPPPFSAKKIQGVPAYKLARRNQPVEMKPVAVEVFRVRSQGSARSGTGFLLPRLVGYVCSQLGARPGTAAWLRGAPYQSASYGNSGVRPCAGAHAGRDRAVRGRRAHR